MPHEVEEKLSGLALKASVATVIATANNASDGQIATRDVDAIIRTSQKLVHDEDHSLNDLSDAFCRSVEQHPSLIPVASTVIGVINATDERIGEQILHHIYKKFVNLIQASPSLAALQILRLLVDLENTCVLEPHGTVALMGNFLQLIESESASHSQREISALFVAGCLPWFARDLQARQPEHLSLLVDALRTFVRSFESLPNRSRACTVINQVLALENRGWEEHVILRSYVHFGALIEHATQHSLLESDSVEEFGMLGEKPEELAGYCPMYLIDHISDLPLFPPIATPERYLITQMAFPLMNMNPQDSTATLAALASRLSPLTATYCIMEVILSFTIHSSDPYRAVQAQALTALLFRENSEFCDAFLICMKAILAKIHLISLPQVDALCEYLSLVLCQASFNIPWTSIIPKTEDLTQYQRLVLRNLLQTSICFTYPTKLKRLLPEHAHELLPEDASNQICAAIRSSGEVKAIQSVMGHPDANDDDLDMALNDWTVGSIGFNSLSESLMRYPSDSYPFVAFWVSVLSQHDSFEDILQQCLRWQHVLQRLGRSERIQDAGILTICSLLNTKFGSLSILLQFLLREGVVSPLPVVKAVTADPYECLRTQPWVLCLEAVKTCRPDIRYTEEFENNVKFLFKQLTFIINGDDDPLIVNGACLRFRQLYDKFAGSLLAEDAEALLQDTTITSSHPAAQELKDTLLSNDDSFLLLETE